MAKIYEDANQQHIASMVLYFSPYTTVGSFVQLFEDPELTTLANPEEVLRMAAMNKVVLHMVYNGGPTNVFSYPTGYFIQNPDGPVLIGYGHFGREELRELMFTCRAQ